MWQEALKISTSLFIWVDRIKAILKPLLGSNGRKEKELIIHKCEHWDPSSEPYEDDLRSWVENGMQDILKTVLPNYTHSRSIQQPSGAPDLFNLNSLIILNKYFVSCFKVFSEQPYTQILCHLIFTTLCDLAGMDGSLTIIAAKENKHQKDEEPYPRSQN